MITIGITAYREGDWLQECWNSVLNQTFTDWDAIIALDGGADQKTEKIFDSIEHPRLTKIQMSQNIGPYPCREAIFEKSVHDIVLYIDADDFFSPEAAEKVLEVFSDTTIAYAGIGAELFWEDGKKQYIKGHPTTVEKLIVNGDFPGYLVFRKTTWLELGKYDKRLKRGKADFDFCLKILEHNLKGIFLPEILIYKRERKGSVSRSYAERMGRVHQRIVKNHPIVFSDNYLRNYFLNQGYLISSWIFFENGKMKRAACFANKGLAVGSMRDYFPLNFAHKMPSFAILFLVDLRRFLGIAIRMKRYFPEIIEHCRKIGRYFGIGRAWLSIRQKTNFLVDNYSPIVIVRRIEVGNDLWVMAGNAIAHGTLHKKYELSKMFSIVNKRKPKSILEIGLSSGANLEIWSKLAAEDAIIVGVDLKAPEWLKHNSPSLLPEQKMEVVVGDSHDPATLETIKSKFPNGLDFLFIDGDHSYEGVKQDYEMYSRLMNKGGTIMFHDINPDWGELYGKDCVEDSGQVYKFWQELKQVAKTKQIIDQFGQSGYGIGVVYF